MAPSIINEVDSQLASLNALKAPGASKTKILAITQLCVSNVQVSFGMTIHRKFTARVAHRTSLSHQY